MEGGGRKLGSDTREDTEVKMELVFKLMKRSHFHLQTWSDQILIKNQQILIWTVLNVRLDFSKETRKSISPKVNVVEHVC